MLRTILVRALLVALPFAVWFAWRAWAKRTGRPIGATPWAWLWAAGFVLMGLSLLISVAFSPDTREGVYVPGEAAPDGSVSKGHFEAVR